MSWGEDKVDFLMLLSGKSKKKLQKQTNNSQVSMDNLMDNFGDHATPLYTVLLPAYVL